MVRYRRIISWTTIAIVVIAIGAGLAWPLFAGVVSARVAWSIEAGSGWHGNLPLCLPDGRLFFIDSGDNLVVLGSDGGVVNSCSGAEYGELHTWVADSHGNIFLDFERSRVVALSPDLELLWQQSDPYFEVPWLALDGEDGLWVAVRRIAGNDPTSILRMNVQGEVCGGIHVDCRCRRFKVGPEGVVGLISTQSVVHACSADGGMLWFHQAPVMPGRGLELDLDFLGDLVIFRDDGYGLQAINRSGGVQWEFGDRALAHCYHVLPVIKDGRMFVACHGEAVVSELKPDGSVVWSLPTGLVAKRMFAGTDSLYLYALQPSRSKSLIQYLAELMNRRSRNDIALDPVLVEISLNGGVVNIWYLPDDCTPCEFGPEGQVYAYRSTGERKNEKLEVVCLKLPR